MPKPDIKLYIILIIILIVLIMAAIVLPTFLNRQLQNKNQLSIPTPTLIQLIPSKQISPALIRPTSTGAREDVPKNVEDAAIQKQNLRRLIPMQLNRFTIIFDYANDQFIVNLQQPAEDNRIQFQNWLKENYPLIPMTKFTFK